MKRYEKFLNVKFGRLLSAHFTGNFNCNNSPKVYCLCDCGATSVVDLASLKSGHTKSCGCLNREINLVKNTKHSMSHTKVYKAWSMAKDRCFNPKNPAASVYSQAGITMSQEFRDDPKAWCEYLGNPPDKRRWSVDRINPFGNYERGNIRWSLPPEQARNTKKNKDNSSGVNGVCWWQDCSGSTYAKAFWTDLARKSRCRIFGVKKFGLLPAFKLAVECRTYAISTLNLSGAGYGQYHGM